MKKLGLLKTICKKETETTKLLMYSKIFIKNLKIKKKKGKTKTTRDIGYTITLTKGIKITFKNTDKTFTWEKLYIEIGKETIKQIKDIYKLFFILPLTFLVL